MEVQALSFTVYGLTLIRAEHGNTDLGRTAQHGQGEASAQTVVTSVLPTTPVMSQIAYYNTLVPSQIQIWGGGETYV